VPFCLAIVSAGSRGYAEPLRDFEELVEVDRFAKDTLRTPSVLACSGHALAMTTGIVTDSPSLRMR
jgi:hypothetical protein